VSVRSLLARVGFSLGAERFEEQVRVPKGTARPRDLLPAAQQLTEAIVSRAVKRVHEGGEAISCRKGCGACCRQVVPVSQTEARHLRDLVARLPEPRRTDVRARFAAARERLEQAGLLQRLRWPDGLNDEQRQKLAVDYFREWIACPFLENESCSIYADRPLVCREYLVTTPAANCAQPTVEPVIRVKLGGRVSVAMGQLEPITSERGAWWMPLILAPAWAEEHPEQPSPQPVFDLLRQLINWLKQTA
jgi:Fe-S-cluster containining protein